MAENLATWVKANGKWLAIGGAVLIAVVVLSEGNQQSAPQGNGDGVPFDQGAPYGDNSAPYDQSSDPGGFDMDKWREEQAADDAQQQERIDRIREVDRCTDPDTGEVHEVPSSIGC